MKVKISFPLVRSVRDYHEIDEEARMFNEIFVDTIKCKEVAFDGAYYAVFYVGKIPAKSAIKQLCLDAGFWEESGYSKFYA